MTEKKAAVAPKQAVAPAPFTKGAGAGASTASPFAVFGVKPAQSQRPASPPTTTGPAQSAGSAGGKAS